MAHTIVHLLRHGEVYNPEHIIYGRAPGYRLSDRGQAMADLVALAVAGTAPPDADADADADGDGAGGQAPDAAFPSSADAAGAAPPDADAAADAAGLAAELAGEPGRSGWSGRWDVTHLVASPLERAQQTAEPIARLLGLDIGTDDDLIEASNDFAGHDVTLRFLLRPDHLIRLWNPWRPSWGERYADMAARMRRAIEAARVAAQGHQALLVSHQLPIWIARLSYEGRSYLHDPRKRQCALASITSLHFEGDRFIHLDYSEPAAALYGGMTDAAGKF